MTSTMQQIHERHARDLISSGVLNRRTMVSICKLRVVPDGVVRGEAERLGYDAEMLRAALLNVTKADDERDGSLYGL